jgi:hypothetical protein
MGTRALREIETLKAAYGGDVSARKRTLLRTLGRARLSGAHEVTRFHEVLGFLQAFPDDAALLGEVERLLARFARRRDLARHRRELADSGIAGTPIVFPFYAPTARWLARRWGERLRVEWKEFDRKAELDRLFPILSLYAETPGLDELDFGVRGWVEKLKGAEETDAAFLVRRFAALRMPSAERDLLYESLEMPLRLSPGQGTPSRTLAKLPRARVVFQLGPLVKSRPDVRAEIARPWAAVRAAPPREADRLIDAARASMVTRSRDLDVFEHASRADVRLAECGGGLQLAMIGARPEARLLLEAVYAFLTLKNGVPVGYVLASALFGSSEIAYNVFETFRGGESGAVYGRVLAAVRHLFGADTFTIFPYQLGGYDNPEALKSGAWWFYRKLGFLPKHPAVVKLMLKEERRMKADPGYRSPVPTLKKLAAENLYFHLGRPREDVIGILELPSVGLKVTQAVAARFGSDREKAAAVLTREAMTSLGLRSFSGYSADERLAFARWAPLVAILPGLSKWTAAERRALVRVIRAKGGRRESDFVNLFDAHRKLRRAIRALAR